METSYGTRQYDDGANDAHSDTWSEEDESIPSCESKLSNDSDGPTINSNFIESTHTECRRLQNLYNGKARVQNRTVKVSSPKLEKFDFNIPLPYVPIHLKARLGGDFINKLWNLFLENGADESEMILGKDLDLILVELLSSKTGGFILPLHLKVLDFGIEDDEFIEFIEVLKIIDTKISKLESSKQETSSGGEVDKWKLGVCCGSISCQVNCTCSHLQETKKSNYYIKHYHRLSIIYSKWMNKFNAKVRIKHIPDILEEADVPYDQSRLPYDWWYKNSENFVTHINKLIEIMDEIRTDKDDFTMSKSQKNKMNDHHQKSPLRLGDETDSIDENDIEIINLKLSEWLLREFSFSEIKMYKKHFDRYSIPKQDVTDPNYIIYILQSKQLQSLFDNSLGQKISLQIIQALIQEHDLFDMNGISFEQFLTVIFKIKHNNLSIDCYQLELGIQEAKWQYNLLLEIESINSPKQRSDDLEGVKIDNYGGYPFTCDISIIGPMDTIYQDRKFNLHVSFDSSYPYTPPHVVFTTRIISVNVFYRLDGKGSLPHLRKIWKPDWNIRILIAHIRNLLIEPNIQFIPDNILHILEILQEHRDMLDVSTVLRSSEQKYSSELPDSEGKDSIDRQQLVTYLLSLINNLNKLELVHFDICKKYLFERDLYDAIVLDFLNKFASP